MSSETVSFSIRMPLALRNEVESLAALNGVSNAKQIIRFVEQGIAQHERGIPNAPDIGQLVLRVGRLEHQLSALQRSSGGYHLAGMVTRYQVD